MANLDFTPLYRSTVGFDHVPSLLKTAMRLDPSELAYPPYNIEKLGEDEYRIVIALSGFSRDDIEIVTEQNRLTIHGKMQERDDADYLHRGIAGRSFERQFDLADYVEVKNAIFEDGLLTIDLKRELPEKLKPRKIQIGAARAKVKTVEKPKPIAA